MVELHDQLNQLYALHDICLKFKHGILMESRQWKLFKPSHFIYSYFTFNSIYSIDWEASFKECKVNEWIIRDNTNEGTTDSKKIDSLVSFYWDCLGQEKVTSIFVDYLKRYTSDIDNPLDEIEHIIPDTRTASYTEGFKRRFGVAYCEGRFNKKDFQKTLYFVYMVRNNIFHGEKTTLQMMDEGQQVRLAIYTAILLAANELLFIAAEKEIGWIKPRIRTNDRGIRRSSRTNCSSVKTANLDNILFQQGTLFYPCCGDDTYEPISLFLNKVSYFHFADLRRIWLPVLECEEKQGIHDAGGRNNTFINRNVGYFPADIIKSSDRCPSNSRFIHIDSKPIFGKDTGEIYASGYKRIWTLNSIPERKVHINCYQLDAVLALHCINSISVFYYRGDSAGEGGSGQWWLGHALFNMVLDKLIDGGLIVTDGSNPDPGHMDAPWKQLWEHKSNGGQMPGDFEYGGRKFSCLGQCGHRYGPVYVWLVRR